MQRAADDVVAALWIGPVVAAGLDEVDFAGGGPGAVGLRGNGEEPDGGPEPVSRGEESGDFDAAVFEVGRGVAGVDAAGFDGVDDGAVGGVCGGDAVGPDGGGAGVGGEEVDDGVVGDEVGVLKGGFDDEFAVADEDVFVGRGGHFELSVAETADLGFFGPDVGVEAVAEVVFVDKAVVVVDYAAEAVPDEEAGDGKTDEEARERDDRDPFLPRVFHFEPWLFHFSSFDPAGVKIATGDVGLVESC